MCFLPLPIPTTTSDYYTDFVSLRKNIYIYNKHNKGNSLAQT